MFRNVLGVWQTTSTTTTPVNKPDIARSLLELKISGFQNQPLFPGITQKMMLWLGRKASQKMFSNIHPLKNVQKVMEISTWTILEDQKPFNTSTFYWSGE